LANNKKEVPLFSSFGWSKQKRANEGSFGLHGAPGSFQKRAKRASLKEHGAPGSFQKMAKRASSKEHGAPSSFSKEHGPSKSALIPSKKSFCLAQKSLDVPGKTSFGFAWHVPGSFSSLKRAWRCQALFKELKELGSAQLFYLPGSFELL